MAYLLLESGNRMLLESSSGLLLEYPYVAWAIGYWQAVEILTTADAWSLCNAAEVLQ